MTKRKKITITLLRATYIAAVAAWFILACGFKIAETKAGIAVLDVVMFAGFGAWILQNYCEWRWEM